MRQIPSTAGSVPETRKVLDAIKENVEELRGIRGTKISPLDSSASTADIISKINEIITRLQG